MASLPMAKTAMEAYKQGTNNSAMAEMLKFKQLLEQTSGTISNALNGKHLEKSLES